jgi:hypothetical protein
MDYLAKPDMDEVVPALINPCPHFSLNLGGVELIDGDDRYVLALSHNPVPADVAAI